MKAKPVGPTLRLADKPLVIGYNKRERVIFDALAAHKHAVTILDGGLVPALFPCDPPPNAHIIVAETARKLASKLDLNQEPIVLIRKLRGRRMTLELRRAA